MKKCNLKNIKSHHSLSLAKANTSRDLQINFNQAEDALTIPTESRHDYECGSATQSGRSMIEMLGVLAIIGVLSVGGIAGYSKAMMKYRINKTIEQITLIAGNVRAFWGPQKNYEGVNCDGGNCNASGCTGQSLYDGCPIVKKAKIFPDEMITVTDGKIMSITNPFGGEVELSASSSYAKGFVFYLKNIPNEACIEITTQDWKNGLVALSVNGDQAFAQDCIAKDYWDDDGFGCIYNHTIPLTIDKAINACSDDAELFFYFE